MKFISSLLFASTCSATRLFVSSLGSQNITTLDFNSTNSGKFTLNKIASSNGCQYNPSWLELDKKSSILYCANEDSRKDPFSTISSYRIEDKGTLTQNSEVLTWSGGVSTTVYNQGKALALAHYTKRGGFLTAISLNNAYNMTLIEIHNVSTPLHQALLDPHGNYIFTPEPKADLVHYWKIDPLTSKLAHGGHINLPKGTGPRHGVFWSPDNNATLGVRYFVVGEYNNQVYQYKIDYTAGGVNITNAQELLWNSGPVVTREDGNNSLLYASEIAISPSNQHLILSYRNDTSRTVHLPDPKGLNYTSNKILSDTLVTYDLRLDGIPIPDPALSPAGGKYPRHFSLNTKGDLIAVALQNDNRVVIMERNITSGIIGDIIASTQDIGEQPGCVIWDERKDTKDGQEENGDVQEGENDEEGNLTKTIVSTGTVTSIGSVTILRTVTAVSISDFTRPTTLLASTSTVAANYIR